MSVHLFEMAYIVPNICISIVISVGSIFGMNPDAIIVGATELEPFSNPSTATDQTGAQTQGTFEAANEQQAYEQLAQ